MQKVEGSSPFSRLEVPANRRFCDEVECLRRTQTVGGSGTSRSKGRTVGDPQICNRLRGETGLQHRILAAACSVEPVRHIRATYEECGYSAAEINSGMNEDERARSWYVCTSYA